MKYPHTSRRKFDAAEITYLDTNHLNPGPWNPGTRCEAVGLSEALFFQFLPLVVDKLG